MVQQQLQLLQHLQLNHVELLQSYVLLLLEGNLKDFENQIFYFK